MRGVFDEHTESENDVLEKGCPEPTDEHYARFVEKGEKIKARAKESERKKERDETKRDHKNKALLARHFFVHIKHTHTHVLLFARIESHRG